ncbi:MlaD family protein [Nocardia africana]|uniref:Virulence factor Mce family protein n=1 Tax=Nocardia africana TaxID=134964 RepID=A0A378X1F4_9NOCA|nr:virulence factor Mce family protein [Nocardia africana]
MNSPTAALRRMISTVVVAGAVGLFATSCASVSLTALPVPGDSYSDGYNLTFRFASVLNLPDRAKVVMDGTRVGVVTGVSVAASDVEVRVRVRNGVGVPSTVHAVLQQDTVLGDIYLALQRADSPAPPLPAGATVPLAQTTAPPQLEDTLAVLANFFSGGSVQRIQNTINGLNAATPSGDGKVKQLAAQTAADLGDLSRNIDQVDQWLGGVAGTADLLRRDTPILGHYVSPAGMLGWDRTTFTTTYIATVLPSIGSIYEGGFWLVPMLQSLGDATGSARSSGVSLLSEGPQWENLLAQRILPFARNPAIDVTSITGPDGRELLGNVEAVLRMLGAVK